MDGLEAELAVLSNIYPSILGVKYFGIKSENNNLYLVYRFTGLILTTEDSPRFEKIINEMFENNLGLNEDAVSGGSVSTTNTVNLSKASTSYLFIIITIHNAIIYEPPEPEPDLEPEPEPEPEPDRIRAGTRF